MVPVWREAKPRSVVDVYRRFGSYYYSHHEGHLPLWMTFLPDYTYNPYLGEAKGRPRNTSVRLGNVKGKGKGHPRTGNEGPEGE